MLTKVPGSLRSEGKTTIAVDEPTKAILKQLAGSMPVSTYVRELAQRELNGKQGALPIHVPGDIAVLEREIKDTRYLMAELVKVVRHYVTHPVAETFKRPLDENAQRAWDYHISPRLQALLGKDDDVEVSR